MSGVRISSAAQFVNRFQLNTITVLQEENQHSRELDPNREYLLDRESLDENLLRGYAQLQNEVSIHVYTDEVRVKSGEKDRVVHMAKFDENPLYMLHSHVEEQSVGQPSIKDLDSVELNTVYSNNPNVRFYIFTESGITEYWLPDEITTSLKKSGDEFRDYYTKWCREKYGTDRPSGTQISTDFNSQFSTFTHHPWGSEEANEAIMKIRGER